MRIKRVRMLNLLFLIESFSYETSERTCRGPREMNTSDFLRLTEGCGVPSVVLFRTQGLNEEPP